MMASKWDLFFAPLVVVVMVGCIGSPEPRNPLKPAPEKLKIDLLVEPTVTPTSVKCLRCARKDTTKNNPFLTDEEKEILKRTDEELKKLFEPKLELEKAEKKKVY